MMINTVKKVIDPITNELGCYRVTLVDNSKILFVPQDPANRHYQEIQEWAAEGNTIEDAD